MDKKILISCGVSNREWVLPYYLRHIYNLDYNKKLIDIYWIVNNSNDKSLSILHNFKNKYNNEYNSINIEIYNNSDIPAETRSTEVREKYVYDWLTSIRNKILKKCVKLKDDYLFSCDSDILVRPDTLKVSLSHQKHILASLLYNGYLFESIENAYKFPNILKETFPRRYEHIVNNRVKHPEKQPPEKLIECDFTGACVLMSREVCQNTDYGWNRHAKDSQWNETIRNRYGEDVIWSENARTYGYFLFACPYLFQYHCMSPDILNYFIENKLVEAIC